MIDVDKWSYFEALDLANEFGYSRNCKVWYMILGKILSHGLRVLSLNSYAMDLANYAIEVDGKVVEMYIEEGVAMEGIEINGDNTCTKTAINNGDEGDNETEGKVIVTVSRV